uniref:hypothetical protein n=2 Tax=Bifidobacterium adolescentis TaxID=1680 RepID=UPI00359C9732
MIRPIPSKRIETVSEVAWYAVFWAALPSSEKDGKMRNTKCISASNFFYGVAAVLLVVQLALILWILKYQFVLTIYDGILGTIAVVVSTVIPAFLAGFSAYGLIRLLVSRRNPSVRTHLNARGVLAMVVALLIIEVVLALLSYYFIHYAPAFTSVNFALSGVGRGMKKVLLLPFLTILLLCAGQATSKNA